MASDSDFYCCRRALLYIGSLGYIVSLGACGWAFLIGMMVLQLVWVALQMPETRGLSLEQDQHRLAASP